MPSSNMSDDDEDSFEAFEDDDEPIAAGAVGTVVGPPPISEPSTHSLARFELKARTEEAARAAVEAEAKRQEEGKKEANRAGEGRKEETKSRELSERESISSEDEVASKASSHPNPPEAAIPLALLTAPKPRPKAKPKPKPKPQASPKPASMPVLNSLTANALTYDLDQLTDPRVQRKTLEPRKSESDFVKRNREMAGKQRSSHSRDSEGQPRGSGSTYKDQVDVESRFYRYRKNVEEKVKRLEAEKLEKEKAACPFQPNTNSKRTHSAGPRSSEDFFQEMMRHKKGIEDRVKFMREEAGKAQKSVEESYFRPSLCEKSKALVSAKGEPDLPVHEKLYQAHRLNMQRQLKVAEPHSQSLSLVSDATSDTAMPFSPAINAVSRQIVRRKPIEQHLLEDAERRRATKEPTKKPAEQRLISENSQQLLVKRFKAEIATAWDQLDESKSALMNYVKTGELLHTLHFVSNDPKDKQYESQRDLIKKMWALMKLEDEGSLARGNFETLALGVMNFPVKETQGAVETEKTGNLLDMKPIGRLESGVLLLNPGDSKRLHSQFKAWYEHRLAHMTKAVPAKADVNCSYKPIISRASQRLAASHSADRVSLGHHKIEDYLIAEAAKKQARQKELQAKARAEEMKECLFAPKTDRYSAQLVSNLDDSEKDSLTAEYLRLLKTNSPKPREKTTALFNLATLSQQRKKQNEKTIEEIDLEAQARQCTFMPNLRRTMNYVSGMGAFAETPKGMEKTVERLVKARHSAHEIRVLRESGFSYRGKKEKRHTESKTEGPLVVLAVQVSGRAEELRVRPGDNLESLIGAFATQHRLSSAETALVQEQLRSQYDQATGATADD